MIEREALACWWGITHFKHYLYGSNFVVRVDHKPLVDLFTTKGGGEATPRISRWQFRLMEHNFSVEYVPGKRNLLGDCLSRLPSVSNKIVEAKDAHDDLELVCCIIVQSEDVISERE